ncbi:MAG: hypothetical protein IJ955_05120 [Oscillospiraceae bacterium]|nr:hypothetical protein [Oscillospiraceae bacterium]
MKKQKKLYLSGREMASLAGGVAYAAVLLGGYYVLNEQTVAAATWERKYHAAVAIEQDAVQVYGKLTRQMRTEQEAREAQAVAYEALGEYQYVGECKITHYCCESKGNPHICGTGTGLTATDVPVTPGMVAVDPTVIPLGSRLLLMVCPIWRLTPE